MSKAESRSDQPISIKKYANRRLYNTATSSYVTLDHLCQMVKDDVEFVVYDAKTGEDITRPVLTQIIVEEEAKGTNLLPIAFLRQLIGFYGDSMQWMVPRYLEEMMGSLAANQERVRRSMQETFGGMFPTGNMEEMGKQNLAFFESAMRMFSPFGNEQDKAAQDKAAQDKAAQDKAAGAEPGSADTAGNGRAMGAEDPVALDHLKRQVDLLQKQLDALTKDRKG